MIEVNFYHDGSLIAILSFYFRMQEGDTIIINNTLYNVVKANSVGVTKHKNGDVSIEQNVFIEVLF